MRKVKSLSTLVSLASFLPLAASGQVATPGEAAKKSDEPVITLEKFIAEENKDDPNRIVPNQPTSSILGLNRSLYDTPRSATNISSEFIKTLAIRNSEDIARIAPSTFSNFRFGLQGNVSVRNQTSDFYFRGMRRIDPQGNYRTIFAANDSIEIVRGPPSPIYGLGRIGGYLNFNPKTARLEKTGKYLDRPTGEVSYTFGSYGKNIVTTDVGGPVKIAGRNGGYQVFGYYEDSDSYYSISPHDRHKIIQATLTLDLTKNWRLETGAVSQYSYGGLPGGVNRTTQDFVNTGRYWDGTFSYNLDSNGDSRISDTEIFNSYFGGIPQGRGGASTAAGNIGASRNYVGQVNAPLNRRFPWQGGPVNGGTITVAQFQAGYLDTAPTQVGGTAVQRQGLQLGVYPVLATGLPNTAVAKQAFYMPPAFDPKLGTWQQVPFDYRRSFGEDYYEAYIYTFFFDLVNDTNEDLTYKNQFLLDTQDQEKTGRNPFSQFQNIFQIEDKITVVKTWHPKWDWLEAATLGSVNGVYYDGGRRTDNTVDYDFRRSLMSGFTPNDTFSAFTKNSGFEGSALSQFQQSNYLQWGFGLLADITLFKKFNLMVGGRGDSIDSEAYVPAGVFNRNGNGSLTVASTNPAFKGYADYAKSNDFGWSYSGSASFELIRGLKPYFTYAVQSAPIGDASTGGIPVANVRRGPIGESQLREVGIKGSYYGGKLFFAVAAYDQTRNNFDPNDGAGVIGATRGRGIEGELRWSPSRRFSLTAGMSSSKTVNLVSSGNVNTNARFLGYPDVVDATGKVVIPAEAFGWGGIISTNIPAGVTDYDEVNAIPDTIVNLTPIYTFKNGISIRATAYYQGNFAADRLKTVIVKPVYVFDAGIAYTYKNWEGRLNILNVFDKLYFNGGSFNSVAARLPRTFDSTITYRF
ncbi:MAG: TonB-dependent receptor [Opitutaceae bacterium]|nr:TonB-dependent receptor [Opitutaceae bacterium]